jgi:hypothetical protein
MSEREARAMVTLLMRVCGGAPVTRYRNQIEQEVVAVVWSTGAVCLVSVKECVRYATFMEAQKR